LVALTSGHEQKSFGGRHVSKRAVIWTAKLVSWVFHAVVHSLCS